MTRTASAPTNLRAMLKRAADPKGCAGCAKVKAAAAKVVRYLSRGR